MGSAVELVELYCLVEVAGLADLPRLVEEVAMAGSRRCVEEAGSAGSPRSVEEAGSVGSVELLLVEQNWFLRPLQNMHEGILD
jgi:hypothetical protein